MVVLLFSYVVGVYFVGFFLCSNLGERNLVTLGYLLWVFLLLLLSLYRLVCYQLEVVLAVINRQLNSLWLKE